MGFFSRGRTTEVQLPSNTADPLASVKDQLAARGSAMVDKGIQVYKQHPKLIGGLAMVAGAAILAGMKRRSR